MLLSGRILAVAPYGNLSEAKRCKEEQIGIVHRKLSETNEGLALERCLRRGELRMPGESGYVECICGGQGDCPGCLEAEEVMILKAWH